MNFMISQILRNIIKKYYAFETWFNYKCSWFFTNGMKSESSKYYRNKKN